MAATTFANLDQDFDNFRIKLTGNVLRIPQHKNASSHRACAANKDVYPNCPPSKNVGTG